MIVEVHLHGPYRQFHDGPVRVEASTPKEAIEAVTRQLPGFQPDLNGMKRARVLGVHNEEDLYRPLDKGELHLMPAASFAGGDDGILETIIGVVLIVVGAVLMVYGQAWGEYLIQAGIGMVIGGIIQMLAPQPEVAQDEEERRSRYLGSPGNTAGIGTRIPIAYGRNLWAGHFFSLNIDATDVGV